MLSSSNPGCFGHVATNDPECTVCHCCEYLKPCTESASERRAKLESLIRYRDKDSRVPTLKTLTDDREGGV